MKSKILVGADAFMSQLAISSQHSKGSFYVQAMTFEGDKAGEQLIELMITCPASDKRLMIDSFSKVVVSDHFLFGPKYLRDRKFRQEIKNTKRLVAKARNAGIQVKYTNPVGLLMLKYPLRNHKKMMIIDEQVCYLGGINFSDHNFEWHDMMVELEDAALSKCLAEDFKYTWLGKNQSRSFTFSDSTVFFFNGIKSKGLYRDFFSKISGAKKSVQVISPYISEPLLPVLRQVADRGVEVTVISPRENNKSLFKNLLLSEFTKGYFQLFHYLGMSHLKAILIDDETLVFGSSNYDLISYYFEQEVVFTTREEELVRNFKDQLLTPMLNKSEKLDVINKTHGFSHFLVKGLRAFCEVSANSLLRPH